MADSNDPKNSGKKLNAAAAQKMREQLANKIAELSDDELNQVAGGTIEITPAITTATLSLSTPAIPFDGGPSGTPGPPTLSFPPA